MRRPSWTPKTNPEEDANFYAAVGTLVFMLIVLVALKLLGLDPQ